MRRVRRGNMLSEAQTWELIRPLLNAQGRTCTQLLPDRHIRSAHEHEKGFLVRDCRLPDVPSMRVLRSAPISASAVCPALGGVLARSHGLVFSSAAGGAHWQIAIRCPSLPFPSVKVHQAAVLVHRFRCPWGGGDNHPPPGPLWHWFPTTPTPKICLPGLSLHSERFTRKLVSLLLRGHASTVRTWRCCRQNHRTAYIRCLPTVMTRTTPCQCRGTIKGFSPLLSNRKPHSPSWQ